LITYKLLTIQDSVKINLSDYQLIIVFEIFVFEM